MPLYLLDTNAVSDLMRLNKPLSSWLSNLPKNSKVVTCAIVRGEILFGIARLVEGKRRDELEMAARLIFDSIPSEPVPAKAGDHYAAIKLARQRSGLALDENDLWIAATALSLGATLVSRDRDFNGIAGLSILTLA